MEYPLWEVHSKNSRDALFINTIHKLKWNDFACKTIQCVDLWRNDEMQSQSSMLLFRVFLDNAVEYA